MKKDFRTGYIALALVSFFWGTTYIASKIGANHMPGLFVSGVRQFLSGLIMVSFFIIRRSDLPSFSDLKKISLQGILLLCIANGCLTWSLEYISSGLAAIIAGLVPLFITMFTVILNKYARVTRGMFIGLIVGFAGIVTIFYNYLAQLADNKFLFGVLLALLSTLVWSFGTVYTAKQKSSLSILNSVGWQMLIAGTVMLIICGISGKYIDVRTIGHETWYALIYLILVGSLLAYSAYVVAIAKLPPTLVSIYAYINPIVAVALGWMLLNEKLNVNMILGTLITVGGIYLVNYEFRKQRV